MNTSERETSPTLSYPLFQAADDLKAAEYVSPCVSACFTDPQENKVGPDKTVQGCILMGFTCGNNLLSVVMDWTTVNLYVWSILMRPHCNHPASSQRSRSPVLG